DLRKPGLHKLLDVPRDPGLSELLRGEADLADVIRPTPASGLWLIPAGKTDSLAVQALALEDVATIFQRLKEEYDFIVIDSSPVLSVADSLLVGQHVDAVIFSLLREVSQLPRVYAAYQRLAVLGIRTIGAVVNGAILDTYGSRYAYDE